ncbi:MAG: flagellin [Kiritimatiellia bacterium]|jgi:flagellin
MPLVINTNMSSLNSQRQMMTSGKELDQAMERLSSGKRINSAADDAAGLAIANRMTSQIRGLDQAIRNANDGVSLIQTAEGALDESTNILQRMRELAIQSSNGIYSDTDRATLDAEVQQLVQELDRIAETTSFNGQNILDGTLGSVDLQVGSEANQTVSFSIQAMNTATLGLGSTSSDLSGDRVVDLTALNSANAAVTFSDGDILINGQGLSAFDGSTDRIQDIVDDVNANLSGVSASAYNVAEAGAVGTGIIQTLDTLTVSVFNASDNSQTDFNFTSSTDLVDLVSQINIKTGGIVDASIGDGGKLVLSNDTGAAIGLSFENTASGSGDTLDSVLGVSAASVTDQGGDNPAATTEFVASADDVALFTGSLALSSDDGSDISVTKGANGTDTDLANLGFRETTSGEVTGLALTTSNQALVIAAGDLSINGTAIAATTTGEGLQGKVDNINDVTATTGVVASASASESYTYDASITPVEIKATNAYTASADASYLEVHLTDSAAPSGFAALTADVTFQVDSELLDNVVVTLEANVGNFTGVAPTDFDLTGSTTHEFRMTIDGVASNADIDLTAADYINGEGMAAALELAINADANHTGVGVEFDGTGFVFTSGTSGATSSVAFTAVGASSGADIGFTGGTAIDGAEVIADAAGLVTAINTDLVAGGSSAEAFIDANSKLAFRETGVPGAGGTLDVNTMANATADDANVNALMGFDFAQTSTGAASYAGATASFSLNGTDIDLSTAQASGGSITAIEIAEAVNDQAATTGVTAYVDDADKLHFAADDAFILADDSNESGFVQSLDASGALVAGTHSTLTDATGSVKINGSEVSSISLTDIDAAVTTINAAQGVTGVTAALDENGEIKLSSNSSITIEVGQTSGVAAGRVLGVNFVDTAGTEGVLDEQTVNAGIELSAIDSSPISIDVNANGATATGLKDLNTDLSGTVTGSALSSISVGTAAGAQSAIDSIDTALETINSTRSELGAINNRLDFTVSNLANVAENATAARSRIVDADFAAETAALSRSQVLQQASQAMLAQANARPQQVLSLLN